MSFRTRRGFGTLLTSAVVLAFAVAILFSRPSYAASANNLNVTVSPPSVPLSGKPGTTVSTQIQVENNAPGTANLKVTLGKFNAQGNSGEANILPASSTDASVGWVTLSPTTISAIPGVWNTVTMTINIPSNAALGYYYAVLFSLANTPTAHQPNTNTINAASAVFVLLNVQTPNEKKQLEVASFTSTKGLYDYLPATFNVNIHNNGNIFLAPTGDIFISRGNNSHYIATIPINEGGREVLPNTDRNFQAQWADGFPVFQPKKVNGQTVSNSNGQPALQLNWNFSQLSKFRFGHYYAHLVMVYNNGSEDIPVYGLVSFWVIPWQLLLIIFIVLVIIIAGIWTVAHKAFKIGKNVHKKTKVKLHRPGTISREL